MKKSNPTNFRDELIRLLTIYTLIPMIFVVIGFIVFLGLYFNSAVVNANRTNNTLVKSTLEGTFYKYSLFINTVENDINGYTTLSDSEKISKISKDIVKFLDANNDTAEFYILNADYNTVFSTSNDSPAFMPNNAGSNWGISYKLNNEPHVIQYAFFSNNQNYKLSRDLIIGKSITTYQSNEVLYILFEIPSAELISQIDDDKTNFIVTNSFNDIYLSNTDIFTVWYKSASKAIQNKKSFFAFNNEWYYKYSRRLPNSDLLIYTITPIKSYLTLFLVYGGVFLVVVIIFYYAISKIVSKLTKDKLNLVDQIISAFQSVQNGNLNVRMDIKTNDELEIISQSYNLMLESLNTQIEKNVQFAKETVRSEIKQLESQFNPHFLFNALTNINYMINIDPDSASQMIFSLAKILRYSIDNTIHNVTLEEDLTYVKNYLLIEQTRFSSRLTCNFDIAENTLSCIIPKLIFQPIIENAIIYGFDSKEFLTIDLQTYTLNDVLHIKLTDNGSGIDKEKLASIKKILSEVSNESKHIGLYNIHRRIKLTYGDPYGISIDSELNSGTQIIITIPVKKENFP